MASRGNRGGAGERVLEGRHVIGLFMLMLVFSGVFFALGYVMGRNQYDGQVRASTNATIREQTVLPKQDLGNKHPKSSAAPPVSGSEPSTDENAPPSSDWGFYNAGKVAPDDRLKPPATNVSAPVSSVSPNKPAPRSNLTPPKPLSVPPSPVGAYNLQVAALRKEADAQAVASSLLKKKFPAFVIAPGSDKYFHVQVGPYSDAKSAEAAKKGLETAGFKAIVKH
jgi:DedD protein